MKRFIIGLLLLAILAPMGCAETVQGVDFPFGIDPFESKEKILEDQTKRFGEFSEFSGDDPLALYSVYPENVELYGMKLDFIWLWLQDEAPEQTSVFLELQGASPSDLERLRSGIVELYGAPTKCIQSNPDYDISGNVIDHPFGDLIEKGKAAVEGDDPYGFYAVWITQYPDRIILFSIDVTCGGEKPLTADLRWGFLNEEEYAKWIEAINQ